MILVTGASGFVGSALCRELVARGRRVRGASRFASESPVSTLAGVDYLPISSLDSSTDWSHALAGVDCVVHCAALAASSMSSGDSPINAYQTVNVEGTRRLAEQAASVGVRRLVFISSVKAVGEKSQSNYPLRVSDDPRPEDDYGASKLEAEQELIDVAAQSGLEFVIVRPPIVYGPGVKGNFLRLIGLVSRGMPLPLGAVKNSRSLVYIENLVDFLSTCIDSPAASGKIFFVSDDDDLSTVSLIREIGQAMGRRPILFPVPVAALAAMAALVGKQGEVERLIGNLQVDITANRDLLGWTPPFSAKVGIRQTVQWYLKTA